MEWCGDNHLILNVGKTKEMIVDFRWTRIKSNSISIIVEEEEVVVEENKHLDVHLDNRLDWRHTDAVDQKRQSRLYFWRKMRSFSVYSQMFRSSISLCWRVQSLLQSSSGGAASETEI